MKRGALLFGIACLALGGCHGKPVAANDASQQHDVVADPQKELSARWAKLFTDTRAVAAAADEFGYKTKVDGSMVTGTEQLLPDATSPVQIRTNFDATAERIVMTFAINDAFNKDSKALGNVQRTPNRIVRGFLSRFDVGPADPVISALQQRKPGSASGYGVTTNVEVKPGTGGANARDLIVTISRTNQDSAARK